MVEVNAEDAFFLPDHLKVTMPRRRRRKCEISTVREEKRINLDRSCSKEREAEENNLDALTQLLAS